VGLRFILGKPGTGKTSLCLREIGECLQNNIPLYYLVPEQFSLQSEKLLLTDRTAATRVQVLSFNRLAYRLFATFGGPPGKLADDLGKQILLRKVLFEISDKLTYYKSAVDKHGFVESLAHTITEMNQYQITADDLTLRAKESPPILAEKLSDISKISVAYRELVKGRYLLTDDMLDLLCQRLETAGPIPLLDGTHFWVDGFSGFTPQERQVLKCLMKRAKRVSVTLTTAADPRLDPPQITMDKLTKVALDGQIEIEPALMLENNFRHANSPEIKAFVNEFTMLPQPSHCERSEATQWIASSQAPRNDEIVEIISAQDRYAAVNTAASHILDYVKLGYNFRDIAILCGDRTHYEKILQTTFDRLNIPLFVDTEIDILAHPLTELIRAALEIVIRNYSYESVFRFLKTRMTKLSLETIDVLENYVLEHGISSFRWRYPFKNLIAEAARTDLLSIFANFTKSKNTVADHCRKIFDMLYLLNVPATLQNWYEAHNAAGDHLTANTHKQIWPKICEIFDKLVEMLGNEEMTVKTFAMTLDAGFAQVGLGRVPPTTDQVVLGDIGRSRYPQIKAMIVLGANENVLPPVPTQAGLFTDRERQTLNNTGVEFATENIHRIAESYYSLYCALSQPSEKLTLIFSQTEPSGKPLRPSPIITRMQEILPGLKIKPAKKISEFGTIEPLHDATAFLSESSISCLYGDKLITAASRLESFARCPFAYFMTYILKAKTRKRFEVLPTDLGSLFHDVIAQFPKQWGDDLTRADISYYVDEIVNRLTTDSNIYNDTARNRYVLEKVRRTSAASIWALNEHIKLGEFMPNLIEQEIRTQDAILLPNGKNLILTGVVDRVDILEVDDSEYVKIIDYKSGNTKFSLDDVRRGVQLQLMIYMNVLVSTRNAKPGGMFYFPISNPLLETNILLDDKLLEAGILKQYKMSGIALAEEVTLTAIDKTLAPGTGSSVIPVTLNKDGKFKKTSANPTTLSPEGFEELGREVENKIIELGGRMTCGDISAQPYTKGPKSPCNFCNYGAVCGSAVRGTN